MILYCEKNEEVMEMRITPRYHCVMEPQKIDAELMDCLAIGMGLFNRKTVLGVKGFLALVGCGIDELCG